MFALGDFTVNTVLTSLAILYVTHFLLVVVGLRPELAGAVQLIGRTIDAFADPAMGRISDRCRWRWGRRRPFFLIGAIPFGAGFGLLWLHLPEASQLAMFAYYTVIFVLMSLSMTVVAVPYLALQPEMALGYDARTSLNAWRNAGSILGVFAAIAIRPVADAFGGGPEGFMAAGALYGAVIAAPWFAIWAVTWERPDFQAREAAHAVLRGRAARRAPRQLPPARGPVPVRARRDGSRRRDADPLLHALARPQRRLRAHDGPVLRRGAGVAAVLGPARRAHREGDRVRDRRAVVGGRARDHRVRRSPTGRAGS